MHCWVDVPWWFFRHLPFPTPFSLKSLTFLPSYSRAIDLPSAAQLTYSCSDLPKTLHLSQVLFLGPPRAVPTSHRHPYHHRYPKSFPIFLTTDGIAPPFKKPAVDPFTSSDSLHQSQPLGPFLCLSSPSNLVYKPICGSALLQLPFLHLLLCPYVVDGFLISQIYSQFPVCCSYLLPSPIASCQPSCSGPGFPRAVKLSADSQKPMISIYHNVD